jgi:hypothetical protein
MMRLNRSQSAPELGIFSLMENDFQAVSHLQVSPNHRFLADSAGKPFFWLGDTAWTLLQRLDSTETVEYLDDRAAKGFNVLQCMGIMEFDGLRVGARANGEVPLINLDPARPNEKYWNHVEWVINEAARRGMILALLPTWGDKWNQRSGIGPEIFTPDNAESYGAWLGQRFRDEPLVWVLGGDRTIDTPEHLEITRRMARGLRSQCHQLITFHPPGQKSSAEWLHDEEWLDFNIWQTGHSFSGADAAKYIEKDYARTPVKPVLDGEPRYEDHPIRWRWDNPAAWDSSNGYFDDFDARQAAYSTVFAGGCGITYGANSTFQCYRTGQEDRFGARTEWREALQLPGAAQMQHLKKLLVSRPYFSRIPDQSFLLSGEDAEPHRILATRDADGAYALVYIPNGQSMDADFAKLCGTPRASWFDPRTGESHETAAQRTMTPPDTRDWVLVLDA